MDYRREFNRATRAKLVAAEIEASRQVTMSRSLFSSGELIVGTTFRLESSMSFSTSWQSSTRLRFEARKGALIDDLLRQKAEAVKALDE